MANAVKSKYPIRFCYRCGRRVDPNRDSCWYCGAHIHREIRPPRFCEFCGEQVPHGAVKCRHCGEFLDGRPRPEPAQQGPQQIVYVVDKSLLDAARNERLLGGRPVPPEVARHLDQATIRAIESNQPGAVRQSGIRELPPGEVEIVDAETQPARLEGAGEQKMLPGGTTEVVRSDRRPQDNLPSRVEDTPQEVSSWGRLLGRALGAVGHWLIRTAPGRTRPQEEEVVEGEVEERYRICENCGAENLASDNFCYHCGAQYHKPKTGAGKRPKLRHLDYPSNAGLFFVIILLIGAMGYLQSQEIVPPPIPEALGAFAILLSIWAFFRRRLSTSQFLSILLIIITIAVYLILLTLNFVRT